MSTFSIVCWTFAIAFQLGYWFRALAEARAGKSQAELIGDRILAAVEELETQRKFAGRDMALTYSAELEDLGSGREFSFVMTDKISLEVMKS